MNLLEKKGAFVDYNDPHIPILPITRKYRFNKKKSVPFTKENLTKYNCVIIVTDHSEYDPAFILEHANLIVDTRRLIKTKNKKVIKA